MQLKLDLLSPAAQDYQIWETLNDTHKEHIASVITRILIKAAMHNDSHAAASSNDSHTGSNSHE